MPPGRTWCRAALPICPNQGESTGNGSTRIPSAYPYANCYRANFREWWPPQ